MEPGSTISMNATQRNRSLMRIGGGVAGKCKFKKQKVRRKQYSVRPRAYLCSKRFAFDDYLRSVGMFIIADSVGWLRYPGEKQLSQ